MSVYQIITKTLHLPVYVMYQCQSCKKAIMVKGAYDISSSYSTKGAITNKSLTKREDRADELLFASSTELASLLQNEIRSVTSEYRRIQCSCPYCGHPSLSKYDKATIDRIFALPTIILMVACFLISFFTAKADSIWGTLVVAIIAGFFGGRILASLAQSVLKMYDKYLVYATAKKAEPMISMNKELLKQVAAASPYYKDVDLSYVIDMPDILIVHPSKNI